MSKVHFLNRRHFTILLFALLFSIGVFLAINLVIELFSADNPPLGTHNDFLAFFTAGHLVLTHQVNQIYDSVVVANFEHTIVHHSVGAAGYMPFLNPPFTGVFLAPLGLVAEPLARIVWFGFNLLLSIWVLAWLTKPLTGRTRVLAFLCLLGTFPLYQALVEGQLSILMLFGCCLAFSAGQKKQFLKSGALLSILWLKPQLGGLLLAGLLLFRQWRIVLGMIVVPLLIILLTLPITGLQIYLTYLHFLLGVLGDHINGAGSIYQSVWKGSLNLTVGINGLFISLFGQKSILLSDSFTAIFDLLLVSVYLLAVQRIKPGFESSEKVLMLAASIAVVLLLDPHLYQQDVVLLYLTIPLLLDRFKNSIYVILGFSVLLDTLILDFFGPVHFFTLLLLAATFFICIATIVRSRLLKQPTVGTK